METWKHPTEAHRQPLHCIGVLPHLHPMASQEILLETFATKYVGQSLGGGRHWRGKLSQTTDLSGNKIFRVTRTVAVPAGFVFYSVYRCVQAHILRDHGIHIGVQSWLVIGRGSKCEPGPEFRMSMFRSGANVDTEEVSAAEQYGLVRLRGLSSDALPDSRSNVLRAGFGIDLLPAWRFGLHWDCAVENNAL